MAGNDRNVGLEDEKSSTIGSSDRQSTVNCMDDGERESPVFRESSDRPIMKLSVQLIDTYKNINKVSCSSNKGCNSLFIDSLIESTLREGLD